MSGRSMSPYPVNQINIRLFIGTIPLGGLVLRESGTTKEKTGSTPYSREIDSHIEKS